MKREDLEKLGLTAENIEKAGLEKDVIDKIMALHGKDIEGLKAKAETAGTAVADVQKQLDAANKTIEDFKSMKPDDLRKAADEWKAKAEKFQQEADQAKREAETKISKMQFDSVLVEALKTAKVKDPKEILPHLDMDVITFKDGKLGGLEDQLKPLMETKAYLFNSDTPEPKIVTKTSGSSGTQLTALEAAAFRGAGIDPNKKD
jgi:DNA-directed RNA polymerase alpha subunit